MPPFKAAAFGHQEPIRQETEAPREAKSEFPSMRYHCRSFGDENAVRTNSELTRQTDQAALASKEDLGHEEDCRAPCQRLEPDDMEAGADCTSQEKENGEKAFLSCSRNTDL
jgi:hypothetical protein